MSETPLPTASELAQSFTKSELLAELDALLVAAKAIGSAASLEVQAFRNAAFRKKTMSARDVAKRVVWSREVIAANGPVRLTTNEIAWATINHGFQGT